MGARPSVPICVQAISSSRSASTKVDDLAALFRKVWSLGKAGVEVPLTIYS